MTAPRQVSLPVGKFSRGRSQRVRLLILHTTEGAMTVASLAGFLNRPGINASYHASVEPSGLLAYHVNRTNTAWHCRGANPYSDGLCLCGFAKWSRADWLRRPAMLDTAAWWLASCARDRGVPLRKLSVAEVRDAVRDPRHPGGVAMHWDYTLATRDGTHWDIGSHFPWDVVLGRARELSGAAPPPAPVPARTTPSLEDSTVHLRTTGGAGAKHSWPTQRISYGFDPGTTAVRLAFGFPGGWVHEAKWWVANKGANRPHDPVPVNFSTSGGQERHGGMTWVLIPPGGADEVELLLSAPGGVHIFPGKA